MEGPSPRRQPGLCWQENVTLADILSLRDSGLSEQEAWAVCLECSLAMRSVAHAAIFQTLCITPDTLAFNTSGNVCFMEQLSGEAWAPARSPGFWGGGQAGSAASGHGAAPHPQEGSDASAPSSGKTAPHSSSSDPPSHTCQEGGGFIPPGTRTGKGQEAESSS